MKQEKLQDMLESGALDGRIREIYACTEVEAETTRARLHTVLDRYAEAFGDTGAVGLYSGPGRTELGGNHTDHQHGHVLAGAVDLDMVACAGVATGGIHIVSEGFPDINIDPGQLEPLLSEQGTSAALVRGICRKFIEYGYRIGGFRACIASNVPGGSGLSSSAAYEVLIGVILNHLFCADALSPIQIAQIGQYAENIYFGKPCGLMDQMASALGGVVHIDFRNPTQPAVQQIQYDLASSWYALCIIDSGADHADLTDEYTSIFSEMRDVAGFFRKDVLREVRDEEFWAQLPQIRNRAGDRAALRAIHFFEENHRVQQQAQSLLEKDFSQFLYLVRQSGASSAEHLQNLYSCAAPRTQDVTVAIALAQHLLDGEGAVRVHGGGFAGTIQAFVPVHRVGQFRQGMDQVLGAGSCRILRIRPVGGTVIAD